jgi:hypothetical protein
LFAPALLPAGYILAPYAPDLFAPNALALRRFASRPEGAAGGYPLNNGLTLTLFGRKITASRLGPLPPLIFSCLDLAIKSPFRKQFLIMPNPGGKENPSGSGRLSVAFNRG